MHSTPGTWHTEGTAEVSCCCYYYLLYYYHCVWGLGLKIVLSLRTSLKHLEGEGKWRKGTLWWTHFLLVTGSGSTQGPQVWHGWPVASGEALRIPGCQPLTFLCLGERWLVLTRPWQICHLSNLLRTRPLLSRSSPHPEKVARFRPQKKKKMQDACQFQLNLKSGLTMKKFLA